ncbi:ABC transporter ATP-binding protein [Maritalea myrionectae]|uniref:ABC transporter ATP-binding protein n=1 Tax=Maritalea myrionectae TaxID=454601 RepID=UPI000567147E|nr:ABC transporter ATP-binding protein [Maritalea myrionectae]
MLPTSSTAPILSAKRISKIYNTGGTTCAALRDISIDISPGEFIAIIGRSGSGKSTLINLLAGLDVSTSGEIISRSDSITDITKLSEEELARWRGKNVGIVFQSFQLLPSLSVLENILMPMDLCNIIPKAERLTRAKSLLDDLEILHQSDKLPSELSGGQQQRAAIARALANDPNIIFADEPTGNLDTTTAKSVMDLFAVLCLRNKSVVMVTHDLALTDYYSRTFELADGVQIVSEDVT